MKQSDNVKQVQLTNYPELQDFARRFICGDPEKRHKVTKQQTLQGVFETWKARPATVELRLVSNDDSVVRMRHISDDDSSDIAFDIVYAINSLQYAHFKAVFSSDAVVKFSEWSTDKSSFVMEIWPMWLDMPVAALELEFISEVRFAYPVKPSKEEDIED